MELTAKVDVKKITVAGNDRTSLSFFSAELGDLSTKGITIAQAANKISQKAEKLLSTDIFDAVDANLVVSPGENGGWDGELRLNVKEKQIPTLSVNTYMISGGTSEIGCEIQTSLRNPIGFGEIFKLSNVATQSGGREYLAKVSIPNVGPQRLNMNLIARSSAENQPFYTSINNHLDSVSLELSSLDHRHQLTAEYALRDEIPVTTMQSSRPSTTEDGDRRTKWNLFSSSVYPASAVTTHTAAASLKTSLRYQLTALDTRDCVASPSRGSFLQGSVEVAAPPGALTLLAVLCCPFMFAKICLAEGLICCLDSGCHPLPPSVLLTYMHPPTRTQALRSSCARR